MSAVGGANGGNAVGGDGGVAIFGSADGGNAKGGDGGIALLGNANGGFAKGGDGGIAVFGSADGGNAKGGDGGVALFGNANGGFAKGGDGGFGLFGSANGGNAKGGDGGIAVGGSANGGSGGAHGRARSARSSYADLQRLRRASNAGPGAMTMTTATEPAAAPAEGDGLHMRHGARVRKASLTDGVPVGRIKVLDQEEPFEEATREINLEISERKASEERPRQD